MQDLGQQGNSTVEDKSSEILKSIFMLLYVILVCRNKVFSHVPVGEKVDQLGNIIPTPGLTKHNQLGILLYRIVKGLL